MEQQQTNNELEKSLTEKFELNAKLQAERLLEHQADDTAHFKIIEQKMETLATKEDIKEMKEAFNDFVYGLSILRQTSKWGYKVVIALAGLVIAIVGIGGGLKIIFGWFK